MKKLRGILVICSLLLLAVACQKNNNNSPYPQITLKGFSPDSLRSGNGGDTAFISFQFFDGDGDLNGNAQVRLIDNRTNDSVTYPFPEVPGELIDPATGISGTAFTFISGQDILIRPDTVHAGKGDTATFSLQIIDAAGNASNKVTTPNLYIRP